MKISINNMSREDRCKLAIDKGYVYDPITGIIKNQLGKEISCKRCGYISFQTKIDGKVYNIKGHQFAWYVTYGEVVDCIDHINGIKYDNRISNLRSVTYQQNNFNNSKAKGYCFSKGKWRALIRLNNKTIHLGLFNNESDARQAYLDAKKIYHII